MKKATSAVEHVERGKRIILGIMHVYEKRNIVLESG